MFVQKYTWIAIFMGIVMLKCDKPLSFACAFFSAPKSEMNIGISGFSFSRPTSEPSNGLNWWELWLEEIPFLHHDIGGLVVAWWWLPLFAASTLVLQLIIMSCLQLVALVGCIILEDL